MKQIYLLLGRYAPDLSMAEVTALFSREGIEAELALLHPTILGVTVTSDPQERVVETCQETGTIVKVLEPILESNTRVGAEELAKAILSLELSRPTFAFTDHRVDLAESDEINPIEIKRALKQQGLASRFLETKKDGMPWVVMHKESGLDLHLITDQKKSVLLRAVWVQPVEDWVQRDMEKPFRDKRVGMLPPKLARTMVNLAVSSKPTKPPTILDPFCGSGTILMEAGILGYRVVGADLHQRMIDGARDNLEWLSKTTENSVDGKFILADAANLNRFLDYQSVDAIVTEPFLGDPLWKDQQIPRMMRSLEELYLGSFRAWKHVLKPGGRVVIVFPEFHLSDRTESFAYLIDRLTQLGYTRENGPIVYEKPRARLQRQLYIFTNKPSS